MKNQKPSKPFSAFAVEIKAICTTALTEIGKETVPELVDKRFKALVKATQDSIVVVETGESSFKYDAIKAGRAYLNDKPCKVRDLFISNVRKSIAKFMVDVKKKQRESETLCLGFIEVFLVKFENKKMYTYESALHQIAQKCENLETATA